MTDTAPRTIKAYAAYELGLEVKPFEYTSRVLGDDDVEIAITHCGVCGSDLHIISGGWGVRKCPVVPGHEIVGTVTKRGANVTELALGDRVGVGALVFACLDRANCAGCASDIELRCKDCVLTYASVYKDGEKSYGGYAEHVRVSSKYAFKIPDSIPSDLAAPLLCAGANVYKPMKQYVTPGMRVGVLGIGGAGHLAVQFAKALGATPVAFSHSADKEQDARSLGAEDFVLTGDAAQVAKAARSVDVLFVTSDAKNQPFDSYMSLVKFGGRIVLVGLPEDKIVISPFALANSEVSVVGTNAGGIRHMKEMFALAAEKNVRPIIQKHPMSEANAAIQQVHNGTARYRIVLEN